MTWLKSRGFRGTRLNSTAILPIGLLCVLFFFAGFPALIYQLVWQRALFLIFGVNIESVTIVVTAFMLGLGLGSLAGGRLSTRRELPPLLVLAVIEGLTAAFGFVSLDVFDSVGQLTLDMSMPAIAGVTLWLVIVPTVLMGATLPVLVGYMVRRTTGVGAAVGMLYSVNTVGAAIACVISAIVLFPRLGMRDSIYVAVAINSVVALGALIVFFQTRRLFPETGPKRFTARNQPPLVSFQLATMLAGLGGFVSLSYEIFFFRVVSYATGSSAPAFAITLAIFLFGLAWGAQQMGRYCYAPKNHHLIAKHVTTRLIIANLSGLLFLPLVFYVAVYGLESWLYYVTALLIFLIASCWSVLLPAMAHFGVAADDRSGMRAAWLVLANIVGSATGSIVTGFVLMDRMTLSGIAITLAIIGTCCLAIFAAIIPTSRRARLAAISAAILFGLAAPILLSNSSTSIIGALQLKGLPPPHLPFTTVIENRSGIITVDKNNVVFGNGMYDGQFNLNLIRDTNGIVRPFALDLFHPAPRNVLMIGLASGSWAQVYANNPRVASLTVVEINPGYITLLEQRQEVASVLNNPKVRIVTDDGRRWLRRNPEKKFDVIVANATWHFRAHASNLLSMEFLNLAKQHLKQGGIYFYNATGSARAQRTACLAFPYGVRFTNHMLVSTSPIAWDFNRWRNALATYRVDDNAVLDQTRRADRETLAKLMAMKRETEAGAKINARSSIESCEKILSRTTTHAPITDDNMGSEWRHPMGME